MTFTMISMQHFSHEQSLGVQCGLKTGLSFDNVVFSALFLHCVVVVERGTKIYPYLFLIHVQQILFL